MATLDEERGQWESMLSSMSDLHARRREREAADRAQYMADSDAARAQYAAQQHGDQRKSDLNWFGDATKGASLGGSIAPGWGHLIGGIAGTVYGQGKAMKRRHDEGQDWLEAFGNTHFDFKPVFDPQNFGGAMSVAGGLGKTYQQSRLNDPMPNVDGPGAATAFSGNLAAPPPETPKDPFKFKAGSSAQTTQFDPRSQRNPWDRSDLL